MNYSNDAVKPTPARRPLAVVRVIVAFLTASLPGARVDAQQSYIPWSGGPAGGFGTANAGSSSRLRDGSSGFLEQPPASTNLFDFARTYPEIRRTDNLSGDPAFVQASQYSESQTQPIPPSGSTPGDGAPGSRKDAPGDAGYGANPHKGFGRRLFEAYFGPKEQAEEEEASHRQGAIVPFDSPPFPFADHIGPTIGYRDTTVWPLMEAFRQGPHGDWWKKSRIKIYGWADPSVTFGTSRNSNIPLSYPIVPNSLQLSQAIVIFERVTDSVQTDHVDWGFKWTNLYGIDYRYTTAKGWFSDQLLKHNHLYGYDPLQVYVDLYIPWVRQGMIVRLGRFISPTDIEAQLTTENYLYTHSLMYTYDPYTFTGITFITKVSDQWTLQMGAHAGNDMAPWTTSSQANGLFLLKWVAPSGNDSLWGGLDSIGKGYYLNEHDDLQVTALTWGHRFNDRLHSLTESYYIWERNALQGGTVTNGPPKSFFPFTGPGKFLPGLSNSFGAVNYTAYKTSDKSYLVWRNDVLYDPRGFRTGFDTTLFETTLGFIYHIRPWCTTRPEVRFDYSTGQKPYDNGTKRDQFTFNWDIIVRF
jgi:hypothetical protein